MHDICVDESWQWQCLPSPKQMTWMRSSGGWKEQPQHIIQDSGGMKVRLCVSCKGRRNQATWPQSRVILDTLDRTGIYHVLGSGFILLDNRSLATCTGLSGPLFPFMPVGIRLKLKTETGALDLSMPWCQNVYNKKRKYIFSTLSARNDLNCKTLGDRKV